MKSPANIPLFVLSVTCLCLASLPAQTLNIPYVEATELQRSFSSAYCENSQLMPGSVRNIWEQLAEIEAFTVNLSQYDTVECGLSAGPDKRFVVELPPDAVKGYIIATLLFQRPGYGDSSLWADSYTVEIQGLTGQATETYSYAYVGQNGNVVKATVHYEITDDVSFDAIRWTCTYNGGIPVPNEVKTYNIRPYGQTKIAFSYSALIMIDQPVFAFIRDTSVPTCTEKLQMDFNDDCRVDFADFATFLQSWLACTLDPPQDCW